MTVACVFIRNTSLKCMFCLLDGLELLYDYSLFNHVIEHPIKALDKPDELRQEARSK